MSGRRVKKSKSKKAPVKVFEEEDSDIELNLPSVPINPLFKTNKNSMKLTEEELKKRYFELVCSTERSELCAAIIAKSRMIAELSKENKKIVKQIEALEKEIDDLLL